MTPSERRLHPLSFLFVIASQVRQLVVPGLVVLVGAGSAGLDWQAWLILLIIPYALIAIIQSITFRYRFEADDLVMTSGLVFRNERHVPYSRIQNIDAVQNVLHRLLGVTEVRLETGGGDEPEARMRVVPLPALDEIRARVAIGRGHRQVLTSDSPDEQAGERRVLLALGPRQLLLAGFIDSRGLIIVGAAFGLLSELGLFDAASDMLIGDDVSARGVVRQAIGAVFGGGRPSLGQVAVLVAVFVGFVLAIRLLSMLWSVVRLWGFRLDKHGDDLAVQYGAITRVIASIPLRRIQTLTISESPLHRLCRMVSVRADSAGGGGGGEGAAAKRESLAPIVSRSALAGLLGEVIPELNFSSVEWSAVDPGAFRRTVKKSVILALFCILPFTAMLRWWTLVALVLGVLWAWLHARLYVRNLGWAIADDTVLFRSGWLWRELTIARFNKIQAVALTESPFDRRALMATVRVDTAAASAHRVTIPYLARATADDLYRTLSSHAARTAFRW